MQSFDPRPVRTTAVQALLFLAGPGSFEGAQLLAARVGVAPVAPLLSASTHAVLQLVGGFLTLIFGFLAHGVPHLLGFDAEKALRARLPIRLVGVLLLVEAIAELAAWPSVALIARVLLVVDVLVLYGVLVRSRTPHARSFRRAPLPVLLCALASVPIGLGAWAWEGAGGPRGVASDLLLYGAVVPVILAMGFQMFASILQLEFPKENLFFVALVVWFVGAGVRVAARVEPALVGLHAPLLVIGALAWIVAMRGLRPRRGGLLLVSKPGLEMQASVLVGAASLVLGGALGALPRVGGGPLADDLARHMVAIGFVLVVTMAVTLRVLPRFCRGRPSSAPLALATLLAVALSLVLRAAALIDAFAVAAALSGLLAWIAVIIWALHLARGLKPAVGFSADSIRSGP